MTIKGRLQVSIAIVKVFLTRNLRFRGKMGSKCNILFSRPTKDKSLRETTSFDVYVVKIGARGLALDVASTQKSS